MDDAYVKGDDGEWRSIGTVTNIAVSPPCAEFSVAGERGVRRPTAPPLAVDWHLSDCAPETTLTLVSEVVDPLVTNRLEGGLCPECGERLVHAFEWARCEASRTLYRITQGDACALYVHARKPPAE